MRESTIVDKKIIVGIASGIFISIVSSFAMKVATDHDKNIFDKATYEHKVNSNSLNIQDITKKVENNSEKIMDVYIILSRVAVRLCVDTSSVGNKKIEPSRNEYNRDVRLGYMKD